MYQCQEPTAINGEFTNGDPTANPPIPRTVLPANWLNTVQEEMLNLVSGANLQPDPNDNTQILQAVQALVSGTVQMIFPVGSIALRPTNPGNAIANGGFGFGQWTQVKGKALVGVGSYTDSRGETRNWVDGSETGEYSHVLDQNEMPKHKHTFGLSVAAGSVYIGVRADGTDGNLNNGGPVSTDEVGGDQAHNNIQPSHAVYMWRRTA